MHRFFLSAILVLALSATAAAQSLDKFLGQWTGTGKLSGQAATFSMKWEKVLGGKFTKLSFQNNFTMNGRQNTMDAEAMYQVGRDGNVTGHWFDSRGMILPLKATISGNALTTEWGSAETEKGKTIYTIISDNQIDVTDFFMRGDSYVEFAKATYKKGINTGRLDSLFNTLEKRGLALGSLAIAQDGKILYQRTLGGTASTKYRIGSETKMFTAVVIFQMIEEGKLTLDQKLSAFFPGLPNANKITIAHMLHHRSGLHDYTEGTDFVNWMDKPQSHEALLKIIRDKGADFEPNTKTVYCNSNFLLLGYIIEKILNTTYAEAIDKRVVSKIGLRNTYYGRPIDTTKSEAISYKYAGGAWRKEKETDMGIHGGAGSMVSTPTDMLTFLEALFNYKLTSKESVEKMQTLVEYFGMGLFQYMKGPYTGWGHNGRVEEFYSSAIYFPKEKMAFCYITNGILYPREDIMKTILKICLNEPVILPFSTTNATENLDQYIGKYSSDQPPIVVNCTKDGNKLMLETQGHTFEVKPVGPNYFMHAETGYFFEFFPGQKELQIKETDNVYYLKRQ